MVEHSAIEILKMRHELQWPAIESARSRALEKRAEINSALAEILTQGDPDLGVIVCGSIARAELTSGSDIDWSLLVDGGVNNTHLQIAKKIEEIFRTRDLKKPNPQGVFGNLVFSHDLVHLIGGDTDTNSYAQAKSNEAFNELRDISHTFQEALIKLFFVENETLREIAQHYAVF